MGAQENLIDRFVQSFAESEGLDLGAAGKFLDRVVAREMDMTGLAVVILKSSAPIWPQFAAVYGPSFPTSGEARLLVKREWLRELAALGCVPAAEGLAPLPAGNFHVVFVGSASWLVITMQPREFARVTVPASEMN